MESSDQMLSSWKEPVESGDQITCARSPSNSGDQKTSSSGDCEDVNEMLPCVKKPPEDEEEMFLCSGENVERSGEQAEVSGAADHTLPIVSMEKVTTLTNNADGGGALSLINILTRSLSDFLMWMLGSLGILWILGLSRGSRPSKIHEKVSPQKRKQELQENEEESEDQGMDKKRWRADGVYIAIHDFISRMWGGSVGSKDVNIFQDEARTKEKEGSFWKQKPNLNFVANSSVDRFEELCGPNFGKTVEEIPEEIDLIEKVLTDSKSLETESSDIDGAKKILDVNNKKINGNMDDTAELNENKDLVKEDEIVNNSVKSENKVD